MSIITPITLSIIIPALNESHKIEKLLQQLEKITDAAPNNSKTEIIIADGGSTDKTVEVAKKFNVKVLNTSKGRANQMNAGAAISQGSVLWFLHVDSIVSEKAISEIMNCLQDKYQAGCFSLYFYDNNSLLLKALAITSNWRARYLHLIFGDQGFFIEKKVFEQLQGFKAIPIMEDWEISKRVHEIVKVKVLSEKIGTSARRFESGGFFKTLLKMHYIKLKYILGISPEKIAKDYIDIR